MPWRTDESADDWWSRERPDEAVSPDGRLKPALPFEMQRQALAASIEAFGMSQQPRPEKAVQGPRPPLGSHTGRAAPATRSSREVERSVLAAALSEAENIDPLSSLVRENVGLRKQCRLAEANLKRAWNVNRALAGAMAARNKS